ncbi:hypothetical protein EYW49_04010 [Siculibacillus lacustris]|uniref:Uncharacterized protein n=1 Tax=Siculibacillus lacustris TaxID=1549641 RepID=A0A4Q9VVQ6_9HYPH|nr:hypothetical protein [Siculibacillus lacustris]TBW40356.1 hypothetical protein EYW49_04010 [Siculibacillus lacustris]
MSPPALYGTFACVLRLSAVGLFATLAALVVLSSAPARAALPWLTGPSVAAALVALAIAAAVAIGGGREGAPSRHTR